MTKATGTADRQGLAPGMTGNQLKLGIDQARMPGQPSDTLVPEGAGRCLAPGKLGIFLCDLLNPRWSELAVATDLEQPAIVRAGRNMGS